MTKPNPKIVPAAGEETVGPELIEKAILELAEGMRKLRATRLKDDTIVTLLHASSGVPKRQIKDVLFSLDHLEKQFLKPV